MSKRIFYLFFNKVQKASFTEENIESLQRATRIRLYNLEKILLVYVKKVPCILVKKRYVRFTIKTLLSSHAMHQLAREDHLNIQDNYIQAILRGNKQLVAKTNCLKFRNKRLIKALKAEKRRKIEVKG